jgi:hypothetical protein
LTADGNPLRLSFAISPLFSPSFALGVGHIPRAFAAFRLLLPPSNPVVRGVGQNPDPVSFVGSADVVRSHNTPSRIIPHCGKVTEDSGKSSSHKQR